MVILNRSAAFVGDVNKASREVTFIASTESVDRYTEIIRLAAWNRKSLERFGQHGKILANHSYSKWPLARAREARIDATKNALVVTARFPTEGKYKESDEVWNRLMDPVEERTLDESSVGFLPHTNGHMPTQDEQRTLQIPPWGYIYDVPDSLELLELSVVTVPANPDAALVTNSAEGVRSLLQSQELREMIEKSVLATCDSRLRNVDNATSKLNDFFALLEARGIVPRGSAGAVQGANAQKRNARGEGSYGSVIEQQVTQSRDINIISELQKAFKCT